MGFFKNLWEGTKKVVTDIGTKAVEIKNEIVKTAKVIEEELTKAFGKINARVKTDEFSGETLRKILEEDRRKELEKRTEIISKEQEKLAEQSKKVEKSVENIYGKTYIGTLNTIQKIVDIEPIKNEINYRKAKFQNFMRDKVSHEIQIGYSPFEIVLNSSNNKDERQSNIDKYVANVIYNAEQNILDLLDKSITETNNYINEYVNKYLDSELEMLEDLQKTLINLNADKATKDKKLLNIASELVEVSYIEYIANSK